MRVRAGRGTVWAGIDVGKTHHWVCVVDTDGATLLSVQIGNDQNEIDAVIAKVTALAERVDWALDIIGAPSALLLALLSQAQTSGISVKATVESVRRAGAIGR